MNSRNSNGRSNRWSCLTVFAIANLLFWVGVTVAVGLIVSDAVDLGVETFVRERQATAAALWKQVSSSDPGAPARPPGTAYVPPTEAEADGPQPTPAGSQTDTPTPLPTMQVYTPGADKETGAIPRPSPEEPTAQPSKTASNSSVPPQNPTPKATETPSSSPLLLADPNVDKLMRLDSEMHRSASGRPVQIRYQEAALNRELNLLLAANPDLPYHNLSVDLQRDLVHLVGDVTVVGFDVNTVVQGNVYASECVPKVEVESVAIAGVVTPGFVKAGVMELISESLSWYPSDYPLCLEQIILEDGRLTVYGSRR
jgi:hypothetical protein